MASRVRWADPSRTASEALRGAASPVTPRKQCPLAFSVPRPPAEGGTETWQEVKPKSIQNRQPQQELLGALLDKHPAVFKKTLQEMFWPGGEVPGFILS